MLQFALKISQENKDKHSKAQNLFDLFESVIEDFDEDDIDFVREITEQLFLDAGVNYERVNHKGDSYSIAEEAVREFLIWENMPWKS